jgi:hypothetical protein
MHFSRSMASVATLAALVSLVAGCAAADRTEGPAPGVHHVAEPLLGRDVVVAISVDGLKPAALRRLGPDAASAFHRMLRHGARTLNARTLREKTQTLPDHTSMLTGRTATGNRGHGVIVNHDPGGTVHQAAGHHISSMFTVVHDRGGSTALYASKSKFALFDRSWNARSGGRDRVGTNNGRDKIDRYVYASEEQLVDRLLHRLRQRPDSMSFLHLALPDKVGHRAGFGSRRYLRAVQRADALLGRILRTIAHRPTLQRHATVILTADHGGTGTGHRDPTRRANFTIPFLVWGAGVADGANLYRLNPGLRPPGASRTGYQGAQPIRNGDVANLATSLLSLPAVRGSTFNHSQGLRVRR